MRVEILTPRGREFMGEANVLILPTLLGQISVLPHHADLISVLKPGIMKIRTPKEEISKNIEGGILEISQNNATILLKRF